MNDKETYQETERLLEIGRRLHSQAIYERLARLVACIRRVGKWGSGVRIPGETDRRSNVMPTGD